MVSHQLGPGNCDAIRYTPEGEPEGENADFATEPGRYGFGPDYVHRQDPVL